MLRTTEAGRRFEASWVEQRAYVDAAALALGQPTIAGRIAAIATEVARWEAMAGADGWTAVDPGAAVRVGRWSLALGRSGEAVHLADVDTGRVLADRDHPLGLLRYQSFDEADYERFYAQLTPTPEDEWWARWDNTKPGIDAAGAVSGEWTPSLVDAGSTTSANRCWPGSPTAACLPIASGPHRRCGFAGPPRRDDGLDLAVAWLDKPANRLPEALWCSFEPLVAEPGSWCLDKLGQAVSPLDVVRRGGRGLHAVGEGLAHDGPGGPLHIATHDAPLVAPGRPRLLDADPPVPDLADGLHVLLHDNCWGTNFPHVVGGSGPVRLHDPGRTTRVSYLSS